MSTDDKQILIKIYEGQEELRKRIDILQSGQVELQKTTTELQKGQAELQSGQAEILKRQKLHEAKFDAFVKISHEEHKGLIDSMLGFNDIVDRRITRIEKHLNLKPLE